MGFLRQVGLQEGFAKLCGMSCRQGKGASQKRGRGLFRKGRSLERLGGLLEQLEGQVQMLPVVDERGSEAQRAVAAAAAVQAGLDGL